MESTQVTLKNGKLITLRAAEASDAQVMLRHLKITHSESYKNLNQTAEFWDHITLDQEQQIISNFESSDDKIMIAAFCGNEIIGGLGLIGETAPFQSKNCTLGMSIQNEFSNLGLGTHLMNLAIANAKSMGFHRIGLTVRTHNEAGILLYEKMGFRRIGILKEVAFFDNKFCDEYSYELILSSLN